MQKKKNYKINEKIMRKIIKLQFSRNEVMIDYVLGEGFNSFQEIFKFKGCGQLFHDDFERGGHLFYFKISG